jgi:hypothetical protein
MRSTSYEIRDEAASVFPNPPSFSLWLNKKSIIYISIPKKRNDIDDDFRDKHGRYFNPVKPEFITKILSQYGFTCSQISSSGDGLSREGIEWWNLVYERE